MIKRNSGECGVVDHSTPQCNVNKHNNYVHICAFTYLNLMGKGDLNGIAE